jgi:hypothetical protein
LWNRFCKEWNLSANNCTRKIIYLLMALELLIPLKVATTGVWSDYSSAQSKYFPCGIRSQFRCRLKWVTSKKVKSLLMRIKTIKLFHEGKIINHDSCWHDLQGISCPNGKSKRVSEINCGLIFKERSGDYEDDRTNKLLDNVLRGQRFRRFWKWRAPLSAFCLQRRRCVTEASVRTSLLMLWVPRFEMQVCFFSPFKLHTAHANQRKIF